MTTTITPHEADTLADLLDGGVGEACEEYVREFAEIEIASHTLWLASDELLINEIIADIAAARRRGLDIGKEIGRRLSE